MNGKKIVVVIGGGFAGLNAAKTLANTPELKVLLIDQRNHHLFQPLLYQVATAGLNPSDIAAPIRAQFTPAENVEVHWGKIQKVDLVNKQISSVHTSEALMTISYDYLIVACGAHHSYFGHPEWEEFAPGLKTLDQAVEIRRRILSAFERAENETDPELQQALLTFVVVGAGPTGVELAGAIADISRTVLVKDFKRIDPRRAKIVLVEAGPRVLSTFAEPLSQKAKANLEELGVEVQLQTPVQEITAEGVQAGSRFIASKCVLWAAGVQAAKLDFVPPIATDKAGRIPVQPDLSLPNFPEVFVVGDMASIELSPQKKVPGLAPAAIQEGVHAAKVILRSLEKKMGQEERPAFKYLDKGQMATIGKRRAVVQSAGLQMSGPIAWWAWLVVHIFYLVGFKNRAAVILLWIWSYVFSKRGSRLITDKDWRLDR